MKSPALSEILTDLYCAGILDTRKVDALNIILEAEAAIEALIASEVVKARREFLKEEIAEIDEIMILARKDKRKNISWLKAWLEDDERELKSIGGDKDGASE